MNASYQKPAPQKPISVDFVVKAENQTAIDALVNQTGLSKQRIKDAMNKGAVWWTLKGKQLRLRRATKAIAPGTRLQCYYDEQILARKPEAPTLIADFPSYSIWFKPHGLLSQGSQWGDHCSILRWIEVEKKRECYLVHRLDGDAAGLIIIAHSSQSAAKLSALFQSRDMNKYYQARVEGLLALGETGLTINQPIDGKEACSIVSTQALNTAANSSLVMVKIETGRKHQIRRHLADIGHPIIGDKLYGTSSKTPLQLLAFKLDYTCPITKKNICIELPPELTLAQ